jgi:hypothetical protein
MLSGFSTIQPEVSNAGTYTALTDGTPNTWEAAGEMLIVAGSFQLQ